MAERILQDSKKDVSNLQDKLRQAVETTKEKEYLILNLLGSEQKLTKRVAELHSEVENATSEKVNEKLTKLERKNFGKANPIRVVVVGLGYSGVELAATVSERLEGKGVVQPISVDSSILATAPPGNK